ncbi:hypothetical protein [Shewanella sp. TC10]|uniref:hypothetical protein n=1 Tax=Shewanella sp. TC10 TaxID=1419739 RepID=UPI00129D22F8|nr:hypothetical protein [Shewanella sp. TC10]
MNNSLQAQLLMTAKLFRTGQEIEASASLQKTLDNLIPAIPNHNNKEQVLALVPAMLTAQENHDWLNLADTLEHELVSLL